MSHSTTLRELLRRMQETAEARVRETSEALHDLTEARRNENDDDEHDPEGVTLSSEWSRLTGVHDAAKADLQRIDDALERWSDGTYGICAQCGMTIPEGRLEARPFATHCVPCAELLGL